MKKPQTAQQLLDHVKTMEHRERIVFTLLKQVRADIGKDVYAVEIYVTLPFEQIKMNSRDPYRVLLQYTTVDGKTKNLSKRSMKRSLLTLSYLQKLIDQMQ